MPLSTILALGYDHPRMTAQQMADQALTADREARRLERANDPRAAAAREEADAIADLCAERAREI